MKIIRPQTEFLTIGLVKLRPDTEKRNQKRDREIENRCRLESQVALAEDRKSAAKEQAELNFSLFNS
jgi:hypothetical protein